MQIYIDIEFNHTITSPVILSSALGDSRLFHLWGADSKSARSSGRSISSRLFLFTNMNTGVEESSFRNSEPTPLLRLKRILLPVVTLRILQPLQHVGDGWCGWWSCRQHRQIQAVFALLVKLQDCRDLVTDGIFDRLERRSERGQGRWMNTCWKNALKMHL